MKTVGHPKIWLFLLLALGLASGPLTPAQEAAPAPDAPPSAPANEEKAAPAQDEQAAPAPAKEGEMRELTAPESDEAALDQESGDDANQESDHHSEDSRPSHRRHSTGNERISFGGNSTLAEGESAEAVISILGSSTSAGEVGDAVVSVIGGSRVTGGTVGDAVVSVLGNTYVNAEVRGGVVTVMGNVELGPKAVVHGEVVCIGGLLTRDPQAVVHGDVQNIAVAGGHYDFSKLGTWFTECLLRGRMLGFDSRLTWAWMIALVVLGFYALVALVAPTGVNKCVETLEQRPGSSLLAALLTLLLTPIAYILLALTVAIAIGVLLIPLFSLGLFFASLFGKIVMLAWLGRRITRLFGDGPLAHPVFGVLLGGVIVLLLYATPFVGILVYKLLGIVGLGVVVYTLILMAKASRPAKAPRPAAPYGVVPPAAPGDANVAMAAGGTESALPPVSAAPPVISAATLPRVGFWLRIAACLLDVIMVGIVFSLLQGMFGWFRMGGSFPLWFAVYHIAMWATKGTTIGGIICGLKIVRIDDRPLDWGVAVVRALSAFLSLAVVGLGFIWVAFDDEKQSWHDKIAGTTIVKVPKGTALL